MEARPLQHDEDAAPVAGDGTALLAAAVASPATAGALLETLVRGCGLGIALIDGARRFAWANEALAALDGIAAADHVDRPVAEVLPGPVGDAMEALALRVTRTGRVAHDEVRWSAGPDGDRIRLMTLHPIVAPGGETVGAVAVVEEISERERAARRMIDEAASFTTLADALPAMIWMGDDRGRRTFVNRRWLDLTGGSLEDELEDGWQRAVHPDDLPRLVAALREAVEGETELEVEYRLRGSDGEYRLIADRGVPRTAASGRFLGHVGACADVTDMRALDVASRESRRLLDLVLDAAPIGFALLSRDLRLLRANPALAAITGLGLDSHLGRLPEELLPEGGGSSQPAGFHRALVERVLAGGEPEVDVIATRDDAGVGGPARHLQESWYPVRDPLTDEITAVGAFVEDITDRVWAQARLQLLSDLGTLLDVGPDEEVRLAGLARLMVPTMADAVAIDLRDREGHPRLVAVEGLGADDERALREGAGGGALAAARRATAPRVLREGLPVAVSDASWSAIAVPLQARDRTLGIMTAVIDRPGRRYAEADVNLMRLLGRRAGLAVDNLRLLTEERRIAQVLQQSLLPPGLPAIPGLEAAARYTPMGEGAEVGGDFYDLFAAGRAWGAAIGDVCGKGVEAAALTSLARHGIRALGRHDPAPSRLLDDLNELIRSERGNDTRFFTVLYVRLVPTPRGFRATVATAGHPLPLVLRADGRTDWIGIPGRMLGPFAETNLEDQTVALAPGDALVLYTDGVTEARTGAELFGEERLRRTLAEMPGASAEALAARVEEAVTTFQAGPLRDDMAVLVLRVAG
jgi:PAS domain S-box-containing protein